MFSSLVLYSALFLFCALIRTTAASNDSYTPDKEALINAKCRDSSDCPTGTECVAASADQQIQTCVKSPVCSGPNAGNCPVFDHIGQLLCVWVESDDECRNRGVKGKRYDDYYGIYKCVSVERCDKLKLKTKAKAKEESTSTASNSTDVCSQECNAANGKPCNGRGSCRSTGPYSFACSCDHGWTGPRCSQVVSDVCMTGAAECGDHGECVEGKCVCTEGWSGQQCEVPPANDGPTNTTTTKTMAKETSSGTKEEKGEEEEEKGETESEENTEKKGQANAVSRSKPKSKARSTWTYVGGTILAAVVVGILVAVYVQKQNRKREFARSYMSPQEEQG